MQEVASKRLKCDDNDMETLMYLPCSFSYTIYIVYCVYIEYICLFFSITPKLFPLSFSSPFF